MSTHCSTAGGILQQAQKDKRLPTGYKWPVELHGELIFQVPKAEGIKLKLLPRMGSWGDGTPSRCYFS